MPSEGFVTISDSRYFVGVQALTNSIRCNSDAPVAVIDVGLSGAQRRWLSRNGISCHRPARSIPVDSDRFFGCYALFDVDAAPFDRMIVIDPDVLVLEDVRDLFRRLDRHPLLATPDHIGRLLRNREYRCPLTRCIPKRPKKKMLQFLARHPNVLPRTLTARFSALSSGTVVVRRELIAQLRKTAMKYADFFGDFPLPDQNLLSLCLADMRIAAGLLDYEDNAAGLHFSDTAAFPPKERREAHWLDANVRIEIDSNGIILHNSQRKGAAHGGSRVRVLHYSGARKPWHEQASFRRGFLELWQRYYRGLVNRKSRRLASAS
ncbi:MAG TPA: hypothetical protein VF254_02825 [Gammaproteobacteria bacterium]